MTVHDLEESFAFYQDVLGFKALAKRKNQSAYFLAGEEWIALVQNPNSTIADNYAHIAFSVADENFAEISARICDAGAKLWQANSSPGKSLYFLDPSGNRLEIHAGDWKTRIQWLKDNPHPNVEVFI